MVTNPNEVSVYFSGHNIAPFADLAIKSFLDFYPELKERIFYFDDCSNDNTKERLNYVNIVTWTPELKLQLDNKISSEVIKPGIRTLINRCDYIFKDMLQQCNTRYVYFQDGDTLTLNGGFIEKYIESGIPVFGADSKSKVYSGRYNDSNYLYRKYIKYTFDDKEHGKCYTRLHPYHLFLDLDNLPDLSELYDNLNNDDYLVFNDGSIIDVGSDLYNLVRENDVKFSTVDSRKILYHWSWISSAMRDKLADGTSSELDKQVEIINTVKNHRIIYDRMKKYEISPRELVNHLNKYRRGSSCN